MVVMGSSIQMSSLTSSESWIHYPSTECEHWLVYTGLELAWATNVCSENYQILKSPSTGNMLREDAPISPMLHITVPCAEVVFHYSIGTTTHPACTSSPGIKPTMCRSCESLGAFIKRCSGQYCRYRIHSVKTSPPRALHHMSQRENVLLCLMVTCSILDGRTDRLGWVCALQTEDSNNSGLNLSFD